MSRNDAVQNLRFLEVSDSFKVEGNGISAEFRGTKMKRVMAAALATVTFTSAVPAHAASFILSDNLDAAVTNSVNFYLRPPYPNPDFLGNARAHLENTLASTGGFTDYFYFTPVVASLGSGAVTVNSLTGINFAALNGVTIESFILDGTATGFLAAGFNAATDAAYTAAVTGLENYISTAPLAIQSTQVGTTSANLRSIEVSDAQLNGNLFYRIVIRGTGPAGKSYDGNLDLTAVPEPTTWAMMLAGFGFIGFAMRRQRKGHPNVRFAF